jgi:hypothetical protein
LSEITAGPCGQWAAPTAESRTNPRVFTLHPRRACSASRACGVVRRALEHCSPRAAPPRGPRSPRGPRPGQPRRAPGVRARVVPARVPPTGDTIAAYRRPSWPAMGGMTPIGVMPPKFEVCPMGHDSYGSHEADLDTETRETRRLAQQSMSTHARYAQRARAPRELLLRSWFATRRSCTVRDDRRLPHVRISIFIGHSSGDSHPTPPPRDDQQVPRSCCRSADLHGQVLLDLSRRPLEVAACEALSAPSPCRPGGPPPPSPSPAPAG